MVAPAGAVEGIRAMRLVRSWHDPEVPFAAKEGRSRHQSGLWQAVQSVPMSSRPRHFREARMRPRQDAAATSAASVLSSSSRMRESTSLRSFRKAGVSTMSMLRSRGSSALT